MTNIMSKTEHSCLFDAGERLRAEEVKKSQTIDHVRIHVDRVIQHIKKFRILRNEIPLTLHGSMNQIRILNHEAIVMNHI